MHIDLQRYRDDAVHIRMADGHCLRVARTLFTCGLAAAALEEMRLPPETDSAYVFVNVHNPARALHCDGVAHRWACDSNLNDHPVWGLNWAGASLVCAHLGARLPWAAEWVAFASGLDPERRYPWGDDPPSDRRANYGEHVGGTTPVGRYPPTALGLLDVAGNLDEWCADHGEQHPFERVVKGGAWSRDAPHLEIAATRSKWARLGTTTIGFRPVWDD